MPIALATQLFDALHVRECRDECVAGLPYAHERRIPDNVGGGARLFRRISDPFRDLTLLFLFEPELFQRFTTAVPAFPRFFGVGATLLGVMACGFGGPASVLGVLALVLSSLAA